MKPTGLAAIDHSPQVVAEWLMTLPPDADG